MESSMAFIVIDRMTTRLPVRSDLSNKRTGGLVVRWETTGESPLFLLPFFLALHELPSLLLFLPCL